MCNNGLVNGGNKMKALIFNSGLGNRVGEFSKTHHKSMLPMPNGETIFGRQIRILKECGIKEFIVTTGPFKEQLEKEANRKDFEELEFTFVENPIYDKTNYIYSMYLASKYLDDDMLFLHGDLVFDKELAKKFILNEAIDMAMVNKALPRPEKDFKGRVENNKILEVSVKIFDDNCYAFQPFYKLCRTTVRAWCDKVAEYVDAGTVSVYAENAMNEIFPELNVKAFSYEHNFIDEIDNMEDHERVTESIRMFDYEQQETYEGKDSFLDVARILKHANVKKPLLVCDAAYNNLFIKEYIESLPYNFIKFSEFNSNPKYEEVVAGRDLFLTEGCDFIISIGGGSTIDTAKNIKLFSAMDSEKNYLEQDKKYNPVKHLAIPTTGGTGSEGNRNSVLYYKGIKQSICHDSILPDYVILEPKMLETLPDYQKKSTMLDALSQCIESMWAVNSCEQSRAYAAEGIKLIMDNLSLYLKGESLDANMAMLRAANYSGKATNLSQTTAPHAMSYKLSSMYNIAHGHAVAICLPHVCQYMLDNMDKTTEGVDSGELRRILETLSELILGEKTKYEELAKQLDFIVSYTGIESPELKSLDDIDELVDSVNLLRLGNNPVTLDRNALKTIYLNVFHKKEDFTDEDEYLDKKKDRSL